MSPPPRTPARRAGAPGGDAALLRLARTIATLRESDVATPLEAALDQIAAVYADGSVAAALYETWLARRRVTRPDKTRVLALGWAREQVRLALEELLEAEARRGRARSDISADTLAWVLLAGCEAIAHEPPGGAPERIKMLLTIAGAARAQ